MWRKLIKDDWGISAIGLGLIAAAISIAIIASVQLVGVDLNRVFSTIPGNP